MNLDKLVPPNHPLHRLISQSRQWQRLDAEVKRVLPPNLQAHVRTACIEEGCLVLLATNNMAANRLRMLAPGLLPKLQAIQPDIREVRTRLLPEPPAPEKHNTLQLSDQVLDQFEESAERLAAYPKLAASLRRLAQKHRK